MITSGQVRQTQQWLWEQIPVKRQLTTEEVYSGITYSTHIVWNCWLCNNSIVGNAVQKQKATHKSRGLLCWLAILPKLSKIVDSLTILDETIFIVDNVVLKQLHNNWQDVILLATPVSTHVDYNAQNWSRFWGLNRNFKIIKRSSWVCQGTPPSPLWQLVQATSIGAIAKLSTSAACHIGNCNSAQQAIFISYVHYCTICGVDCTPYWQLVSTSHIDN